MVAGLLLLNSRTGLIDPGQRTNDYSIGFFVFLTILVVNLQVGETVGGGKNRGGDKGNGELPNLKIWLAKFACASRPLTSPSSFSFTLPATRPIRLVIPTRLVT